jgi:hypothetical protein
MHPMPSMPWAVSTPWCCNAAHPCCCRFAWFPWSHSHQGSTVEIAHPDRTAPIRRAHQCASPCSRPHSDEGGRPKGGGRRGEDKRGGGGRPWSVRSPLPVGGPGSINEMEGHDRIRRLRTHSHGDSGVRHGCRGPILRADSVMYQNRYGI